MAQRQCGTGRAHGRLDCPGRGGSSDAHAIAVPSLYTARADSLIGPRLVPDLRTQGPYPQALEPKTCTTPDLTCRARLLEWGFLSRVDPPGGARCTSWFVAGAT